MDLVTLSNSIPELAPWLALSKDNSVTVDAIVASNPNVKRTELVARMKALELAGFGAFIIGRRGAPSRFSWKYTVESAQAVLAGTGALVPISVSKTPVPKAVPVKKVFIVRPGVEFALRYPDNVTKDDVHQFILNVKSTFSEMGA
jgi:hypothetical protein